MWLFSERSAASATISREVRQMTPVGSARDIGRGHSGRWRTQAIKRVERIVNRSAAVPEAIDWNIASCRIWTRSATNTFSVLR